MKDTLAHATDALRRFWTGRRAGLVVPSFNSASQRLVSEVEACGARLEVAVTCRDDLSLPAGVRSWRAAGLTGDDLGFRQWQRAPSRSFERWLDGVDEPRGLTFVGDPWMDVPSLAGRSVHGWRRPAWASLEDKTKIDDFWREIGVTAPRCKVVACRRELVEPIAARLDGGRGVLVATDATRGFSSGSSGLAWVRTADQLSDVAERFATHSERVRIAEFILGVPCSVLAMVMSDGAAVFEPIEIVTLFDMSSDRLTFCGYSNRWRPSAQARDQLRGTARQIAECLAAKLGYRGIFSVDGIQTDSEFYATELNARHASGLGLWAARPDFPIYLFNRAVQESLPEIDGISARNVEESFCQLIRSIPSHSISVPASVLHEPLMPGDMLTATIESGWTQQVITYTHDKRSATIRKVEPLTADGIMAPAASVLARRLAGRPLRCFKDEFSLDIMD